MTSEDKMVKAKREGYHWRLWHRCAKLPEAFIMKKPAREGHGKNEYIIPRDLYHLQRQNGGRRYEMIRNLLEKVLLQYEVMVASVHVGFSVLKDWEAHTRAMNIHGWRKQREIKS